MVRSPLEFIIRMGVPPPHATLIQVTLKAGATSLCLKMQEEKPAQLPPSDNFMGTSTTILAWRNIFS